MGYSVDSGAKMDGVKVGLEAGLGLLVSCGTGRAVRLLAHILAAAFRNVVLNVRAHEIEHLTQQLRSQNSGRREEAARLLAMYASVRPLYRTWIAREGAIPRLVPLLKSRNMRARLAAADAVRYLALDKTVRDAVVQAGAVPRLTRLLRRRYVYRLRISSARALGTLAVGPENVHAIASNGAFVLEAIRTAKRLGNELAGPLSGRYMRTRNKGALLAAILDLLTKLSDDTAAAEECRSDGDLFHVLSSLINSSDADVVTSTLGLILRLLECGCETLKNEVLKEGLVPRLVKIWQHSSGLSQTLALNVLVSVAETPDSHKTLRESCEKMKWVSRSSLLQLEECMNAQLAKCKSGVLNFLACLCANLSVLAMLPKTTIITTLTSHLNEQPGLSKASVCRALAALCMKPEFRKHFEHNGAVPELVELLFWEDMEVVESAVQALCRFASSESSQMLIATPRSLQRLLDLQTSDNNTLVCSTLELLRQLYQRVAVQQLLREVEIPVR